MDVVHIDRYVGSRGVC